MTTDETADVVVVGGGPAGLAAAIALRGQGVARVVVLEREAQAGGVPRHSAHLGYGMRDMHRIMAGPAYAAAMRTRAEQAGVDIRTATTATDWTGATSLQTVNRHGMSNIHARAVVLATGVRERPRAALLVPGDRGGGVFTTGSLQQLTTIHHGQPGTRAVIVGAQHVSFSAVLTLQHAACRTVAMVTPLTRHQTYAPLRLLTAGRHRVPIITGCTVEAIHGRDHVRAVTLSNGRRIDCDTVVFTGDWIPDHELARRGDIVIDDTHRGPAIDTAFRTNRVGVFAIGNMVHPAETADVCALDGRHAATAVRQWLEHPAWPTTRVRLIAEAPVAWVAPSRLGEPGTAPGGRITLRVDRLTPSRTVAVTQGTTTLWWGRPRGRLVPNRSITIPGAWLVDADPGGADIIVSLQP
ncbi:unannotated protein [freshwater metagenome]|uniref:Unannotated protein n=1 Tax=freshwater metagenome TaxID=449393 RepID=A0A6J7F510_9ZZZZ|nr:FAD-binding protein [Actinomycetota bacterium]